MYKGTVADYGKNSHCPSLTVGPNEANLAMWLALAKKKKKMWVEITYVISEQKLWKAITWFYHFSFLCALRPTCPSQGMFLLGPRWTGRGAHLQSTLTGHTLAMFRLRLKLWGCILQFALGILLINIYWRDKDLTNSLLTLRLPKDVHNWCFFPNLIEVSIIFHYISFKKF